MPDTSSTYKEDADLRLRLQSLHTREAAFAELVALYKERLYWHIRKMLVSHEDTDDVLQEVFLIVWRKLSDFRGDAQLFTWIYRIATNACLQFLRKKKRRFFFAYEDISTDLYAKLESEPYIEGDAISMLLQKAILQLPDKQRLVFNMRYFEEMKYSEISAILTTSEGALKASYHHATTKIKDFIQKHTGETFDLETP
ncbi:MAG: sigma-70 family RNA polymerase sigma factor [Bernardetiaceae bacterium]|nr:sigma-70 family RNA polymerase sigma factor [Bernardetiaceae bacterium]